MHIARSWVAAMAVACFAWMISASLAQAKPISFTVPISGSQQVPPVQTSGKGTASLTYDPETRVLTWSVSYSDLTSAATMAHFHGPAPADKNAGVQVWISKQGVAPTSPMTGQATLTAGQAAQFMDGEWYINIHTKDHPSGEIRGQVIPPKS